MNRAIRASLVLAVFAMSGCAVYSAADWEYVTKQWGGMRIDKPQIAATKVVLPIEVGLRPSTDVDSAICLNGASAKTKAQTIYVSLKSGLCSSISRETPWQIVIARPAPGSYRIVYDDEAAGFPVVGSLQVPGR